jgi:ribosome-associated protein
MSLQLDLNHSAVLNTEEIERIKQKCPRRVNKLGIFQMHCDSKRSQLANKKELERRFVLLIKELLTTEKKRKKSVTPPGVKAERLKKKKMQSEKKQQRRFRPLND